MLDIKLIRHDREGVEKRLKLRDPTIDLSAIAALDDQARGIKTKVEQLKNERNDYSKKIGEIKRTGGDASQLMSEVAGLGDQVTKLDLELRELEAQLHDQLAVLPNLIMEDVPVADDPADNVNVGEWGSKPHFSFEPKNHVELGENLFDFARGAKITGTGWPVYKGLGARLEWALLQYMVDFHNGNQYTQVMVPHCVRPEMMFGSGQLPKFADQSYKLDDKDYPFYLLPTAEVALNGLHYDEILDEAELPKKYFAYTPCFRREAGAAGSQERGLIRVHQFNKVEMFCFAKPDQSEALFDEMVNNAAKMIEGLGLHYRKMLLVTGDMGHHAAKTIDLEVWLPGQDRYYEVSSVSNCLDYQARRSSIRYKKAGEKAELVHTLNGSGLATSRLMVALLESNQQADGSITIPPALSHYLGGMEVLC